MDLFRHCLDLRLVDRNQRRMGRVDGIVLELRTDRPPRIAYIEVGPRTIADRLSASVGRMISNWMNRGRAKRDRYQIPWGKISVGLNEIRADVDAEKTPALAFEMWLRKKVIGRIPGA